MASLEASLPKSLRPNREYEQEGEANDDESTKVEEQVSQARQKLLNSKLEQLDEKRKKEESALELKKF